MILQLYDILYNDNINGRRKKKKKKKDNKITSTGWRYVHRLVGGEETAIVLYK